MFGKTKFLGLGIGIVAVVVLAFIVGLLVVKLLWAWVVKDLFPGAVEQGLLAEKISWWTSFKIAVIIAILSAFWGRGSHSQ